MPINNPPLAAELTVAETQVFNGNSPIAWTDLDLSAVVGAQAALVLLKFSSPDGNYYNVAVRKDGDTDEFYQNDTAHGHGVALAASISIRDIALWVPTSDAGIIEWRCQAAVANFVIDVMAYIR